jgi:hypothetical protein
MSSYSISKQAAKSNLPMHALISRVSARGGVVRNEYG